MKPDIKRSLSKAVMIMALFCMTTQPTLAALLNLAQSPLFAGTNIPPKVLLTISKDQQLYKKAYNDYTDLDSDGKIDTTYKHSINYYGYFDPTKCYTYQNGSNRFEPARVSATKLCGAPNEWSGNFLNWVSMSRIDAVRKLLYGGMRSTDLTGETVLERAYLPTDAHAWAKHYLPPAVPTADLPAISNLTPFNPPVVATLFAAATASFAIPGADGDYVIPFSSSQTSRIAPGDQIRVQRTLAPANSFIGAVLDVTGSGQNVRVRVNFQAGVVGSGTDTAWTVTNLSTTGISFCNLTKGGGGADKVSTTNTQPPLLRVVQGNFALWNANEREQCLWADTEKQNSQGGFAGGLRSNGNQAALSEINASAESPIQNGGQAHSLGNGYGKGEFVVRVQACKPGLVGGEKCKVYPSGNLKPIGLLQEYGDRDRIHFGLMTGSYTKNISGGVLRKNVGPLATGPGSEVNANTNGTFVQPYRPPGSPRSVGSAATPEGIINTLNYMRIYGYNYGSGDYLGAAGDNCTYQLTALTEDSCTSWGNPMSEVFFEAVRYFASPKAGTPAVPQPTAAYVYGPNSKDNQLGLPLATWTDPLSEAQYCAPLNVVVFNASVSSNDDDLRLASPAAINATAPRIADLANIVGTAEGITGGSYFAGKLVGIPSTPNTDAGYELCTAKTITGLGDISGICPEGPTTAGSFLIAGLAHQAHTKRIRSDLVTAPPVTTDPRSLKVTTFGVQLATNTPQLVIPVPNSSKTVVIQPIYRLDLGPGRYGGGGLVDMRYVKQNVAAGTGKVYVNWEDSEQGGDYDQDMWGTIEWAINAAGTIITVTTNAVSASTGNPQGFGYAISGTSQDGPHFHSGIYNFNFTDPSPAPAVLGCTNCNLSAAGTGQRGPTSVPYTIGSATAQTLKDPLWYAAKYGGFVDLDNNGFPGSAAEWDSMLADGTLGADTVPDNYFLVTNPLGLETALGQAFNTILKGGSGSAVAANSTSTQTLNALYQAKFSTGDWSGQMLALGFTAGVLDLAPKWDAGAALTAQDPNTRAIITYNNTVGQRQGVPFRWPVNPASPLATEISSSLVTALNTHPDTTANDGRGSDRLLYLRGDGSLETGASAIFRQRPLSKLGDIVNSSPVYVGAPSASTFEQSYTAFRNTNLSRTPMVYVGANDGMLHGFEASPTGTGRERLAYVPSKTFANLAELTTPNYVHQYYVDGTPEVQDAVVNSKWRTVLVGGLSGGGQGLYALDVTNPNGTADSPSFQEANANRLLLWEFTDNDDRALGYTYSKPVIRQMAAKDASGKNRWAAIVAGGYNNSEGDGSATTSTGRAFLFVIFLDGPKGGVDGKTWREITPGSPTGDYLKIPTTFNGLGFGSLSTPNSLAPPFAADSDGDGIVNFVYAGDLLGNFWKFDVSNPTPAKWVPAPPSSANRTILFQARSPSNQVQPITAQAEGTFHPTGKGFVVTFGTGKYLEFTDTIAPFVANTMYGIWDKNDGTPGTSIVGQTRVTNRNQLLAQVITDQPPASGSTKAFRTITANTPVWSTDITPNGVADDSPKRHMGWLIELPAVGERVVLTPILRSARLIFVTSIPSNSTCDFGGTGHLMVVNPTTGGRIESVVLDVDGDGILEAIDKVAGLFVSGVKLDVGAAGSPTIVSGGSAGGTLTGSYDVSGGGTGVSQAYMQGFFGGFQNTPIGMGNEQGRVTWRELLTR